LCAQQTVDDVAREAGTIGYEVLTRLGGRFHREFTEGSESGSSVGTLTPVF
jgi:alanine racemase